MADRSRLRQGLRSALKVDPETSFQAQARLGSNIKTLAWVIEILLAITGLAIAWLVAASAFDKIKDPSFNQYVQAIQGSLPFLIIALIEPTKIPLAAGFYKVKFMRWKLLFLFSLLVLTVISFETMYFSLDRNLQNISATITKIQNERKDTTAQIKANENQIKTLEAENPESVTKSFNEERANLEQNRKDELASVLKPFNDQIENRERRKKSLLDQDLGSDKDYLVELTNSLKNINNDITETNLRKMQSITNLKDRYADSYKRQKEGKTEELNQLNQSLTAISSRIEALERKIENPTKYDQKLLDDRETLRLTLVKPLDCPVFASCASEKERFNRETKNKKLRIRENEGKLKEVKKKHQEWNEELKTSKKQKKKIQGQIAELSAGKINNPLYKNELAEIKNNFQAQLKSLKQDKRKIKQDITTARQKAFGSTRQVLKDLNTEIKRLNGAKVQKEQAIVKKFATRLEDLDEQRRKKFDALANRKDKITPLKNAIVELSEKRINLQRTQRAEMYANQLFRFSAMWFEKDDILDVTKEDLKLVSNVWFGSVAFIAAIIGSILALVGYILMDPEAFKQTRRVPISKYFGLLFVRIVKDIKKITRALLRLLFGPVKLLLSIGAAATDAILKPRIKEIIKTVEVPVEKEVEVPVEKVVIKEVEVPHEILRKELVYVPVYSPDGQLPVTHAPIPVSLDEEVTPTDDEDAENREKDERDNQQESEASPEAKREEPSKGEDNPESADDDKAEEDAKKPQNGKKTSEKPAKKIEKGDG